MDLRDNKEFNPLITIGDIELYETNMDSFYRGFTPYNLKYHFNEHCSQVMWF